MNDKNSDQREAGNEVETDGTVAGKAAGVTKPQSGPASPGAEADKQQAEE